MRLIAFAAVFIASVAAIPTGGGGGDGGHGGGSAPSYEPCPDGLFSNAQCCATDALGVVGLDCSVPDSAPEDAEDFAATCAETGQQAKCCVLPVAGQAVLCQDPVGV